MSNWKYIRELSCLSESDLLARHNRKRVKSRPKDLTVANELNSSDVKATSSNLKRSCAARSSMNNLLKILPRSKHEKKKEEGEEGKCSNLTTQLIEADIGKIPRTILRVQELQLTDLKSLRNCTSYKMGITSRMTSKLWNLTRVTVREIAENKNAVDVDILREELSNLCKISHPNILLLMGVCPDNDGQTLQLVFEHVHLGSLYHWMHQQNKIPALNHLADIIIQIIDALTFLHNLHFLHCAITSHAVQLVSNSLAKLGQFEFVRDERQKEEKDLAEHNKALLGCTGHQILYNWLSPEVLRGEAVSKLSDVYSLCCVVYELSTGTVPLAQMSAERISQTVQTEGTCLPIDEKTMPVDLTEVLSKGLQANLKDRVLELHELRGVFHKMKQSIEKDDEQEKEKPKMNKMLPSKPCPSRSLSSSAIQYNHRTNSRIFSNDQSRNSFHSASDYNFVSNKAKRNFLRSQPSSPSRGNGLGPRSKTSLYYDAFSLSSGLDHSSSDSSGDQPGDSSDSSSSSLSPTSGYSSYDMLDQVQNTCHDSDHGLNKRRSACLLSVRDSCSNHNIPSCRNNIDNNKRAKSVPRISRLKNPQDYETGIKPASHRLESHSSNCNVQSAASTPKHSTENFSVEKQKRSPSGVQREYFNLNNSKLKIKYSSSNCFEEILNRQGNETKDAKFSRMRTNVSDKKDIYGQMTRKSFCQSHPRLFSKVSSESANGKSSPVSLTGNMQLSSRYKSSAELVSELLQRPVVLTNFQQNTNKIIPTVKIKRNESKLTKVTKSMLDSQEICSQLKSVELVKNIKYRERKVGRQEFNNPELGKFDQMDKNDVQPEPKIKSDTNIPNADKILSVQTNDIKEVISDKTVSASINKPSCEGSTAKLATNPSIDDEFRCYQYSTARKHSIPSSLSSRPSFSYSIGDTEDLYCDDELHPSLENDPNMRLYTENINSDQHAMDCGDGQRMFEIGDDESILSMEIPSTGPQSLLSCSNVDTASFISDCEDRGDAGYSTVIAWGIDLNTDINGEGEESIANNVPSVDVKDLEKARSREEK